MHLGNGAITPECCAITYTAAAAGLGLAVCGLRRRRFETSRFAMAGALGAAVFAAQMVNVPLLPYASAHLVGGVLVAWVLGAELGALTMAVVLAVQALLLGDGGLMALGANVVNMALLPAALTAGAKRLLPADSAAVKYTAAKCVAIGATAGLAVFGGAALVAAEVSFAGGGDVARFAGQMLFSHSWIGLVEGFATVALVALLAGASVREGLPCSTTKVAATAAAAVLLIAVAVPLSSSLPDGYEAAAQSTGWAQVLSEDGAWLTSLGDANVAAVELQRRIVAACESALGDGMLLAMIGTLLTGILSLAAATFLGSRRLAPASAAANSNANG